MTETDEKAWIESKAREYICYKGDDVVGIGNLKELSKLTGRAISTLQHRSYPAGRKRAGKKGIKVYLLEEDD